MDWWKHNTTPHHNNTENRKRKKNNEIKLLLSSFYFSHTQAQILFDFQFSHWSCNKNRTHTIFYPFFFLTLNCFGALHRSKSRTLPSLYLFSWHLCVVFDILHVLCYYKHIQAVRVFFRFFKQTDRIYGTIRTKTLLNTDSNCCRCCCCCCCNGISFKINTRDERVWKLYLFSKLICYFLFVCFFLLICKCKSQRFS